MTDGTINDEHKEGKAYRGVRGEGEGAFEYLTESTDGRNAHFYHRSDVLARF